MSNNNNEDRIVSLSGLSRAIGHIRNWVSSITHPVKLKYLDNKNQQREVEIDGKSDQEIDLTGGVYYATTSTTATRVSNPLTIIGGEEDVVWDGSAKKTIYLSQGSGSSEKSVLQLYTEEGVIKHTITGASSDSVIVTNGSPSQEHYDPIKMRIEGDGMASNGQYKYIETSIWYDQLTGEEVGAPVYNDTNRFIPMGDSETSLYVRHVFLELENLSEWVENGDSDYFSPWKVVTAKCILSYDPTGLDQTTINCCPIYLPQGPTQYYAEFLFPGDMVYFPLSDGAFEDSEFEHAMNTVNTPLADNREICYYLTHTQGQPTSIGYTGPTIPNMIGISPNRYNDPDTPWGVDFCSVAMGRYELDSYERPVSYVKRARNDIKMIPAKVELLKPIDIIYDNMYDKGIDFDIHVIFPGYGEHADSGYDYLNKNCFESMKYIRQNVFLSQEPEDIYNCPIKIIGDFETIKKTDIGYEIVGGGRDLNMDLFVNGSDSQYSLSAFTVWKFTKTCSGPSWLVENNTVL